MAKWTATASKGMTRAALEAWCVEQGVAQWGEAERAGMVEVAARKSLDTLRAEYDLAADPGTEVPEGNRAAARGALDDGPS